MLLVYLLTLTAAVAVQARTLPLPGSCNFESSTCGYTSDQDFKSWSLKKDGNFISLEPLISAESQSTPEDKRRGVLLSPVLDQEDWTCLRLVYQITGSGSIQVQLRRQGDSFDRPLWSSQTPSDSWVISNMDLKNTTEAYMVVIEGSLGESSGSSVAVFEISILSGYCLECDLEEPHLCGYSNQWNTNVNWYVGGGGGLQDPQKNLPDDHTYNNETGHYMYVDSIYAKTLKEVAKLVSPMTTVPMSGCMSFHYQRGVERGNQFAVYTRDKAGQYQEIWRADKDGQNQNDWIATTWEWIPVQMDLKAPYPLQVVFEVAFNSPRGGHVAVDDITFSPEFCSADTEPTFDPSISNCDFESGFCHYTQELKKESPWRRVSVRPNIFRSGDHTTGEGSFLLAQSQLAPRSGYSSRLMGPILPGNMKYCLRFFYSLRGFNQTDQALAIYLQDSNSITKERIWTQGAKSRNIWIATEVTFQSVKPAKVMFVSACKSFWDCGSVALDDIRVSLGDCESNAASLLVVPGHCDFETGYCGYSQDKQGDAGDWVRRKGPTPTSYTGPRSDHTTGLGHYMHIEASPMLSGQNARLLSSTLRGARGPQCLHFFYHMYGSGTGQLNVYLDKNGEYVLLWKRSGEQSVTWLRAIVEYQCDFQHQIVFEATRGSSVRSDIAIDDIVFKSGPCPEIAIKTTYAPGTSNEIE